MNKQHYIINSKTVRKRAAEAMMNIKADDDAEVIIRKREHSKTAEQRNFWHLLCRIYGQEVGYTEQEMKEAIKHHVLGSVVVTIAGKDKEVTQSSEKQSREMYSRLIDETYRLAAMDGIQLPNPRWNK